MAASNVTKMSAAMVDGDCNGNGRWQRRQATATAMATESVITMDMAMAIAMGTATARATMIKAELPLQMPAMCSAMAGVTPCLHPHGHRKVHSPALRHGGDTAKSISSLSRGRVPDSSPWIVFCLFFTTTVQFTEQPSV